MSWMDGFFGVKIVRIKMAWQSAPREWMKLKCAQQMLSWLLGRSHWNLVNLFCESVCVEKSCHLLLVEKVSIYDVLIRRWSFGADDLCDKSVCQSVSNQVLSGQNWVKRVGLRRLASIDLGKNWGVPDVHRILLLCKVVALLWRVQG